MSFRNTSLAARLSPALTTRLKAPRAARPGVRLTAWLAARLSPALPARLTARPGVRLAARLTAALVIVVVLLGTSAMDAAKGAERHDVIARTFEFDPRDITIAPGDTVQWIWEFGTHTVTEGEDCTLDAPLFNVELTGAHPTFRYVFDSPGTVHYFCLPHCVIMDMQGTVAVTGGVEGRVFEADADGSQMIPPVDTEATAKLRAYLSPAGDRLHVQVAVQNLVNPMTASHLHLGPPGSKGPQVINLGVFEDSLAIDVAVPAHVIGPLRENGIYLAVHTVPYPVGEIRGQVLGVDAGVFEAVLDASQSTNPVDSDGVGFAQVYAWPDASRIHIELEATELTSDIIASHIHEGPPGEEGPIRFDIGAFEGRIVRDFATTPEQIATLHAGGYYINIHTDQYLFGEIRGQLGEQLVSSVPGEDWGGPWPDGTQPDEPSGPWPGEPGSGGAALADPLGLSIRPTVTTGPVELHFELERAGEVLVEAFTASGRRLGGTRMHGQPGQNLVPLDLETTLGVTLPRGRIFLQVRAEEGQGVREITFWR